ncbi:hypothetical protein OIO90_001304 [Microbotryomycetes sp. JL221]|nr:hypothetical protein OIO90_001304 [Microbotryomycetes sp. JL221]
MSRDLWIHVDKSGYTALYGEQLDRLAESHRPPAIGSGRPAHITLLTKAEARLLPHNPFGGIEPPSDLVSLGLARARRSTNDSTWSSEFLVVVSNSMQRVRLRARLPPKDFHITLNTVTGGSPEAVAHDLSTLVTPLEKILETANEATFDSIIIDRMIRRQFDQAFKLSLKHVKRCPESPSAHVRLADSSLQLGCAKLAMLAFASGWQFARQQGLSDKVLDYALKGIVKTSRDTEIGSTWIDSEQGQIELIESNQLAHVLLPWSQELREAVTSATEAVELCSELCIDTRERVNVRAELGVDLSSTPRHEADVRVLASAPLDVRHVVTLTKECPLPEIWFERHNVGHTHIALDNMGAPSMEVIEGFIRLASDSRSTPLLVHCGGGKGRAGTMVACWLVAYAYKRAVDQQFWKYPAMSAALAIESLRQVRPGSIESLEQEKCVRTWSKHISKRGSVLPHFAGETQSTAQAFKVDGDLGDPDLIVLCALPGAGKSWFRKALSGRDSKFVGVCGDEDGGTQAVLDRVSRLGRSNTKVVVDQCNTTVGRRREIVSLAGWARHPVAIWFDYPAEVCEARAQRRLDHPTLIPGKRVTAAISQFSAQFEQPSLAEGFKAVVRIEALNGAQQLAKRLAGQTQFFKFPRTAHLINLGAATRDDLVRSPEIQLAVGQCLVVTEKLDGANLGFSLDDEGSIRVQNRSHFVDSGAHVQFRALSQWIDAHREDLHALLGSDDSFLDRFILFGEWMAAKHSVEYTELDDLFYAFDLFDRATGTFLSRSRLQALLKRTNIHLTPLLHSGDALSEQQLVTLIQQRSAFSLDERREGVYVKVENADWVIDRSKVVRGDFIAGDQHWTKSQVLLNQIKRDRS